MAEDLRPLLPATGQDLTFLEEVELALPEPLLSRFQDARDSMLTSWDLNRPRPLGETSAQAREALDFITEGVEDKLENLGRPRLTSPLFWDRYQLHREGGLPAHAALCEAVDETPDLSPLDLGRRAQETPKIVPFGKVAQ